MTLHLDLLTAESAEAFVLGQASARHEKAERPAPKAEQPVSAETAPVTEALAGNWGY